MNHISHWQFLYTMAQGFPNNPNYQEVQNYREFYEALRYVIPSYSYRTHYDRYLYLRPIEPYLENRNRLSLWVLGLHPELPKPLEIIDMNQIWDYLGLIVHHYPVLPSFQEVLYYKNFFLSVQNVIPVEKDRRQYKQQMREIPVDPYLSSNRELSQWMTKIYQRATQQSSNPIEGFNVNTNTLLLSSLILIGCAAIYVKMFHL